MRDVAPHAASLALLLLSPPLDVLRPALLAVCVQLLPSFTPAEAARQEHTRVPSDE